MLPDRISTGLTRDRLPNFAPVSQSADPALLHLQLGVQLDERNHDRTYVNLLLFADRSLTVPTTSDRDYSIWLYILTSKYFKLWECDRITRSLQPDPATLFNRLLQQATDPTSGVPQYAIASTIHHDLTRSQTDPVDKGRQASRIP